MNLLGADDYSLAPGLRGRWSTKTVFLGNDVMPIPIGVVDPGGEVTRVIKP